MDVTRLLIALFVGMAVLIFLIMKTRLHPSLSLVISACVVGIVGGVELASIPGLITSGFGNTLAGIGLVIAFGCMMGQIMEESNSAKVMAHTFIKALHGKNEEIALAITGFLVSIPIFADSALILLAPLVKSISQTKKKSLTGLALAMACALNITHASVPPTPGPLAVIAQFGDTIDLGTYILFAIAMGIPLMVLIGIMSRIVGRKWYKVVDENGEIVDVAPENIAEYARISSQATVPELDPNESYPSVVMSFAPIFVPVILILASTFTSMMYKGDPTPVTEIIGFLGSPVIAISISLLVSIYGLAGNKSRQEVLDCLERGVKSCGTVILITGAGGAFGNIIKSSGIGDVIANGLASANMPILLLPLPDGRYPEAGPRQRHRCHDHYRNHLRTHPDAAARQNMMYCAYAACIGSQVFSLHNDSFFWVLTRTFKFDKLDVQILGYEGMQFIWSWVGFGLLCIVNAVF
mgnify:FL=1